MLVRVKTLELERRRLEAGLTVTDVGVRAGLCHVTRRRVFRGQPVRVSVARRVAEVFGVRPGELIDVDEALAQRATA